MRDADARREEVCDRSRLESTSSTLARGGKGPAHEGKKKDGRSSVALLGAVEQSEEDECEDCLLGAVVYCQDQNS